MKEESRNRRPNSEALMLDETPSSRRLSGKASVRTTFRLAASAEKFLHELARSSGVTMKDAMEDIFSAPRGDSGSEQSIRELSEKIPTSPDSGQRKTYVISKKTMAAINQLCKNPTADRDLLVSQEIVKYFLEYILLNKRRKSNLPESIKILGDLDEHLRDVERNLNALLPDEAGERDPIVQRFGYLSIILMNLVMAIENELETGNPVDPEDFSQQN